MNSSETMQPNFITHQDELLTMFQDLEKGLTDWDKKYLHLKSAQNFILHLSDIKNTDDETWIYKSLRSYLTQCPGLALELNRKKSDEVYALYLAKMVTITPDS